MSKKTLFVLWGVLFILCAGLGFIPGYTESLQPAVQAILTLLSMAFFLPPFLLAYRAGKEADTHILKLLRNFSALSLGLTLVILVLSLVTALAGELVGEFLHILLILVSAPMVCSGYWVLSLFLWACLLMVSLSSLRRKKETKP